ncbi:SpoIIE family protein phosphatase [Sutcliffiella horikoshii]|uniref:SpoIIE family protein phosphatase n=1 Tax=Sutcliffiella horikoshii TaxID=79883 RepID=UPI001F2D111E|nr:fused response regulator/phosphatase [Sutcliffiella horikoshii]MCG1023186.1 fused response regulator/phosphatase [Sutcliffiella horikoshii]
MGILIVDDNQVNLFVIENILKRAGYKEYISFTSAKEMFDYLNMDNPSSPRMPVDIILMDIMMPEIDGIEACRTLQTVPHLKDIPVIFVTALEDSNKVAEALDAGGLDYVMKPINKTELLARIRVVLRLKQEKDKNKKQAEKIRNQLDLSQQVQNSLLSEPIFDERFTVKASYIPAYKLAGDMYYWYKIDRNRYAVILLDMMGHGISASLVCMFISSVLRDSIRGCADPEFVISELNRWMYALNLRNQQIPYYFTAIYLVIDTEEKTLEYVNAGHPAGFALVDEGEVVELSNRTCALGFFEKVDIKKTSISYEDSVQIMLYTDGVVETMEKVGMNQYPQFIKSASKLWDLPNIPEPLHLVLPEETQAEASDDMCVVLIQAR